MAEYQAKKCIYCGKTFIPKHHRAAYCSEKCRDIARKGQKQRYIESRRQRSQRRNKPRPEAAAEELKTVRQIDRKTESASRRAWKEQPGSKSLEELLRQPGNTSAEYWEAFRRYELDYAAALGVECRTLVNGVAAADPDFVAKVLEAIEDKGVIVATIAPR